MVGYASLTHPTRYALALIRGEPLLFKGDDLARTDINHRGEGPAG
jgi:uncharacterized protein with PIN domain